MPSRRWLPVRRLLAETFVHRLRVPSEAWRAWAGSEEYLDVLQARCRSLGLRRAEGERLAAEASADAGWRSPSMKRKEVNAMNVQTNLSAGIRAHLIGGG
jgi:hypothetical protein